MATLSQARIASWTSRWLTGELNNFAKCGNWTAALNALEKMQQTALTPRNVFHYTTVMKACTQAGEMEAAMGVFQQMKADRISPNVYTYTTLIHGCATTRNLNLALRLFAEMRLADVPPTVQTMTALVTTCSRCGQWQKALQVLDQCEELWIAPNVLTYTAAMDGCRRGGVCAPAIALLETKMTDPQQVRPNAVTYNTVLGACVAAKDYAAATKVYARMAADGYPPISYTRELLMEVFRGTALDGLADAILVRKKPSRWEAYMPDSDLATALRVTSSFLENDAGGGDMAAVVTEDEEERRKMPQ